MQFQQIQEWLELLSSTAQSWWFCLFILNIDCSRAVSVSFTLNYSPIMKKVSSDGCKCCLLQYRDEFRWFNTYWSNSEYWSQKRTKNGNIHSAKLDVYAEKQSVSNLSFMSTYLNQDVGYGILSQTNRAQYVQRTFITPEHHRQVNIKADK